MNRRDVLRLGAAIGLASEFGIAEGAGKKAGPSRIGVIGTGGRGTYLLTLLLSAGVDVPALCDIDERHLRGAIDLVAKARTARAPTGYSKGPQDYRRMLARDDLDAVVVATPMQIHAPMAIDALPRESMS